MLQPRQHLRSAGYAKLNPPQYNAGLTRAAAAGNKRKLRVTATPNVTLSAAHVPPHCRRARTVLLGPLAPADLDPASFVAMRQGAST